MGDERIRRASVTISPGTPTTPGGESGLAVLVVVATTAALSALVAITALSAAAGAAAAAYRAQAAQARWLAQDAVTEVEQALAAGVLRIPAVGAPYQLVNSAEPATRRSTGLGPPPSPVSTWPPVRAAADVDASGGRGAIVELMRVVGPDGEGRGLGGAADPDVLVDVVATAWFRRARARVEARLSCGPGGVFRLH